MVLTAPVAPGAPGRQQRMGSQALSYHERIIWPDSLVLFPTTTRKKWDYTGQILISEHIACLFEAKRAPQAPHGPAKGINRPFDQHR